MATDSRISFDITGKCSRCGMVNVDPTSGSNDGSTLRTLASYRREDGNIVFGVFLKRSRLELESEEKMKDDDGISSEEGTSSEEENPIEHNNQQQESWLREGQVFTLEQTLLLPE